MAAEAAHYYSIAGGYFVALGLWLLVARLRPGLWRPCADWEFQRPWREIGYALLAAVATILVGQLYVQGFLLDERLSPLFKPLNQLIIFSPFLLLLWIRRQGPQTALVPLKNAWQRQAIGVGLSLAAIGMYTAIHPGTTAWLSIIFRVYHPKNLGIATQVFLEEMSMAVLLVRLGSAIRVGPTIVLVAGLFAAGHIPTMLSVGATPGELLRLFLDFALVAVGLVFVFRSKDILWLWPVHFAMDMMQFKWVTQ